MQLLRFSFPFKVKFCLKSICCKVSVEKKGSQISKCYKLDLVVLIKGYGLPMQKPWRPAICMYIADIYILIVYMRRPVSFSQLILLA